MSASKRILLAGATGYIGGAVATELVRRGHDVTAVVRQTGNVTTDAVRTALDACRLRVAEAADAASLRAALGGLPFDAVVSCIASRSGIRADAWRVDYRANRNLLDIALAAGATRFELLSAICVQRPRLAFQHAKLAFEAELLAADVEAVIVRPTAFFKSLAGQIDRVLAGKPFLLFGDGRQTACKPIGAADLARFMVDRLDDDTAAGRILPIGGPGEPVTPRRQGEMLFELTGLPARFRRVPVGLFGAALIVLTPLGSFVPAAAAKAELARIGRYYATESMLVWDSQKQRYDAAATPATGTQTLRDFYAGVLKNGQQGHEPGDHKLF